MISILFRNVLIFFLLLTQQGLEEGIHVLVDVGEQGASLRV